MVMPRIQMAEEYPVLNSQKLQSGSQLALCLLVILGLKIKARVLFTKLTPASIVTCSCSELTVTYLVVISNDFSFFCFFFISFVFGKCV